MADRAAKSGLYRREDGGVNLRLDAFLSLCRIIKRRAEAKQACDAGRVTVDGRRAKGGHRVKVGQTICLDLPRRRLEVQVVETPRGNVSKKAAPELYRVLEDRVDEAEDDFYFDFSP